MGYSYGRTASGRMALSCDQCGGVGSDVGGVRKRHCTFKVLGEAHLFGGPGDVPKRYAAHYCPAPALCGPCLKQLGGLRKLHEHCREGAEASQREADATQALLEAGEYLSTTGWGSWHERVPDGWVGRCFRNLAGASVYRLVTKEEDEERSQVRHVARPLSSYHTARPWAGPEGTATVDPYGDGAPTCGCGRGETTDEHHARESAAGGPYTCAGCGRAEGECSLDPCPAVVADRGEDEADDDEGLPQCALAMGCLCAAHAKGRRASGPCDAREDVQP